MNSKISAIAVIGIRIEDVKKAVAPTIAKAPGKIGGSARFQMLAKQVARSAPMVMPGVNNPPSAPAHRLPVVASSLRAKREKVR